MSQGFGGSKLNRQEILDRNHREANDVIDELILYYFLSLVIWKSIM